MGLLRVALHVALDEIVQDLAHLLSHFIDWLCVKHVDIMLHLIISVLPDELELRVKAVVELLIECLKQLLLHFFKDFSIVLTASLCEVAGSLAYNLRASRVELLNDALIAISLELIDQRLHVGEGLILDLLASEVSDHQHLSGQIEILLLSNDIPGLLHVYGHAVDGDLVARSLSLIEKELVVARRVKASLNLLALLHEGVRLENFVRHHDEFKREEVFRGGVRILLGLVDLTPDLFEVLIDHRLDLCKWNTAGVVTQDEEELLGGVLVKQL